MFRGPAEVGEMLQTEHVEYKLGGLLLVIEGIGVNKTDQKPTLQAFGIVSYDVERETYHMRAFNDGRFLETDMSLDAARKKSPGASP